MIRKLMAGVAIAAVAAMGASAETYVLEGKKVWVAGRREGRAGCRTGRHGRLG